MLSLQHRSQIIPRSDSAVHFHETTFCAVKMQILTKSRRVITIPLFRIKSDGVSQGHWQWRDVAQYLGLDAPNKLSQE